MRHGHMKVRSAITTLKPQTVTLFEAACKWLKSALLESVDIKIVTFQSTINTSAFKDVKDPK